MLLSLKYIIEDQNPLRAISVLVTLPFWQLILSVVCLFTTVILLLAIVVHFTSNNKKRFNLSDGFTMGGDIIFATYGLLLAFLIFGMYESTQQAEDAVSQEVTSLNSIIEQTQSFSTASEIKHAIQHYADRVVNEEWPILTSGQFKKVWPLSFAIDQQLVTAIQHSKPEGVSQEATYGWLPYALKDIAEAHNKRLMKADSHLPIPVWRILIFSTILVFLFLVYANPWEGPKTLIPILGTAIVIAFSLAILISLHYPFTGPISLSPEPYLLLMK